MSQQQCKVDNFRAQLAFVIVLWFVVYIFRVLHHLVLPAKKTNTDYAYGVSQANMLSNPSRSIPSDPTFPSIQSRPIS